MRRPSLLSFLALAFCVWSFPGQALGQVTFQDLGTFGPGDVYTGSPEFVTGGEIYVYALNLSVDCTVGSGHIAAFHTLGSTPDTEIALYGPNGYTLVAGNDDGESGFWGDPGFDSLMYFGVDRVGNDDSYQGYTIQNNLTPWPTDLPAGDYVLVVSSYSTTWDEADARLTWFNGTSTGTGSLTIMVR